MGFSSIMQHACLSQFVVKKAMTNWHFVVWTRHALSIAVWCLEPLVCQRLWGSDGSHRHWLTLACCALKVGRADNRRFWWLSDQYGWKILLVSLLSAFPTCGRLISIATACADSTVPECCCAKSHCRGNGIGDAFLFLEANTIKWIPCETIRRNHGYAWPCFEEKMRNTCAGPAADVGLKI